MEKKPQTFMVPNQQKLPEMSSQCKTSTVRQTNKMRTQKLSLREMH